MKRIFAIFVTMLFVCTSTFAKEFSDEEIQLIKQYSKLITGNLSKKTPYPRLASLRGWEGTVLIDLLIDSEGNYLDSKVEQSTGYYLLDEYALNMIRKSSPYPKPPKIDGLTRIHFSIPVVFQKFQNINNQQE